jgi:hypothetical protein
MDGSHHYVDLVESLQIFLLSSSANKEENDDDDDDEEESAANFGSWSSPGIELRIPLLAFLLGCHLIEVLCAAVSNGGGCFRFGLYIPMFVVLAAIRSRFQKKRDPRLLRHGNTAEPLEMIVQYYY